MSQPTNNRTAATGKREPATGADKTPQVCHTTWEVYIKEKPNMEHGACYLSTYLFVYHAIHGINQEQMDKQKY